MPSETAMAPPSSDLDDISSVGSAPNIAIMGLVLGVLVASILALLLTHLFLVRKRGQAASKAGKNGGKGDEESATGHNKKEERPGDSGDLDTASIRSVLPAYSKDPDVPIYITTDDEGQMSERRISGQSNKSFDFGVGHSQHPGKRLTIAEKRGTSPPRSLRILV